MLKSRWSLVLALSLCCAREASAIELRGIGDQVPDSPGHVLLIEQPALQAVSPNPAGSINGVVLDVNQDMVPG